LFIAAVSKKWAVSNEWAVRGQIGDSFGAVNALFSGLAFVGVLYAIVLQRFEIAHQQAELRNAEASRAESNRALASQGRSLQLSAELAHVTALLHAYSSDLDRLNASYPSFQEEAKHRAAQIQVLIEKLHHLGRDTS
jgi:hypothetical protein